MDEHHVADSTIAPLRGLLDDLIGCSVKQYLPHQRRRDVSHVGQGRLLVHVVRQQILRTREAGAQWMLRTVASENLIGSVQPERLEYFRLERLIDVIPAATR